MEQVDLLPCRGILAPGERRALLKTMHRETLGGIDGGKDDHARTEIAGPEKCVACTGLAD
jgi:hypothetical protein